MSGRRSKWLRRVAQGLVPPAPPVPPVGADWRHRRRAVLIAREREAEVERVRRRLRMAWLATPEPLRRALTRRLELAAGLQ